MANRYEYGVKIDLLHDVPARSIRNRVSDVRDQATNACYRNLEDAAQDNYDVAMELYNKAIYKYAPRLTGERYALLRRAAGIIILTYRYETVKWDVTKAVEAGTPVYVFSPYKKPDMVRVTSVAHWELLCDREATPDWATWMDELEINLLVTLETQTPWLGTTTLKELANQYVSFADFLDYLKEEIATIKAMGEWDVSASASVVYNEKASTWRNTTTREFGSRYKYAKKEYWINYEELPVDIMTEYLHLSYLVSIEYQPLTRIMFDGVDYGSKVFFEYTEDDTEQGLTVTPLYVDPNYNK